MKNQIEGTYEQGYADGRTYYTNDIHKQIHEIKIAIRILDEYSFNPHREPIREELYAAVDVLQTVLEKSKKPYWLRASHML